MNLRKLTAAVLCGAMLATAGLGMTACSPKQPAQEQQDGTAIANPMVERSSLEEVNELSGGNMMHPAVMGVTNEHFDTIDTGDYVIGEYEFELNGHLYLFRTATTDEDISGLYIDGKPVFEQFGTDDAIVYETQWYASRWFVGDQQYVLNVAIDGEPMDEETFSNIADEMASMTRPQMDEDQKASYYADLAGNYQDRVSQRASMTVTAEGSTGIKVEGNWGSSASESTEWHMTAALDENYNLSFTDGVVEDVVYDSNGNREVKSKIESDGYIEELPDGVLKLHLNADSSLNDGEYEKIPE